MRVLFLKLGVQYVDPFLNYETFRLEHRVLGEAKGLWVVCSFLDKAQDQLFVRLLLFCAHLIERVQEGVELEGFSAVLPLRLREKLCDFFVELLVKV